MYRRVFLNILLQIIKHPLLMLNYINIRRLKKCFNVFKSEGIKGVIKACDLSIDKSEFAVGEALQQNQVDVNDVDVLYENNSILNYGILNFQHWETPTVSIIIPVYNQFAYTYACLKNILENTLDDIRFEIIIADDCSNDITADIEKVVKNIKVVRAHENRSFLLNCNNAAKHAEGKYLLFLNNDTQVQTNWLKPLVDLMIQDPSVGIAGSKLISKNGTLQEAGGIVWNDGSAWNYGRGNDPGEPEYNYVKEADYMSGACILIRKSVWDEIGGFDERFAPAYYEDTDLAFEVRKHGYKVVYQPLSRVVHFEGISNGKSVSTGLKHYQELNCKKFYEKWKNTLKSEQFKNGQDVFIAKDRSQFKKHILVIDHCVPHYDHDAGGKCTFMYLCMFVKMGYQVTFIGDNYYKHEPYTTLLNQKGIEVLYGNKYCLNWRTWLKSNLKYFDYVYLQRPHISIKYIDVVKQYGHAKILYFAHDLHHIREYREYELTGNTEKLKSSNEWKKIEYELFDKADVGHVVGNFEQKLVQKLYPNKPIRNIPLYIYNDNQLKTDNNFKNRKDLISVGGFGHPPNIDAVLWFGNDVFPLILKKYPDIKWHVVGSKPTKEVLALASDNIIIYDFVSDERLTEMYQNCRIDVAPLRVGAGVKGKVVEAAYFNIPIVTTSVGAEGLDSSMGNMVVRDNAEEMANEIINLYTDYERLFEMSKAGHLFIDKYFTEKEALRVLSLDIDKTGERKEAMLVFGE